MPLSQPAGKGSPEAKEPATTTSVEKTLAEDVEVDESGDDVELEAGTKIGEYVVESRLGQGGMASVYAATQPVIGKRAAIKVMRRKLCLDPVQVERFVQEARAANQIGHPNIVDVFALGELPDGRSYFVMEWLPGETLATRLRRGQLSVGDAIAILFQICDGLAAAHDKGIVHRDLKPENIFLVPVRNRRLLVKLLDFGVAKLLGGRDERVDRTAAGASPGTPAYMSPEQARGKPVDHRTDIYSLGVTAFEMLLGRRPFIGAEVVDVLYQHVHALPPAPSSLRPELPTELERLIMMMLEKKADRRPTLPQVESKLVEMRDSGLVPMGNAEPLRALEGESGPQRPAIRVPTNERPPTVERTDLVIARSGPPLAVIVLATGLLAIAITATFLKLNGSAPSGRRVPTEVAAAPAPVAAAPEPVAAASAHAPAPVAAPEPARLIVQVTAPDARVDLDGEPLVSDTHDGHYQIAQPGEHELVVSAPHYRTYRRSIALSAGALLELPPISLERLAAAPPPHATPAHKPVAPIRKAAPSSPSPPAKKGDHDYMIDPFASPKK